ncbi:MAG TPA: hypothetical protein VGN32_16065 [Ktedonobacterales bacterium]|nr:hypothetical protein [Ktedonobacterales bacterium]
MTHEASPPAHGKRHAARRGGSAFGRRLWLPLLFGVVVALVLVIYLAFGTQTGTASIAAQDFCAALVARNYPRAYAQLSDRLRQEGTATQFAASQQALDQLKGPARTCGFSNPRIQSNAASFTLTVLRTRNGTASGALRLIEAHGAWRVDGYDANVI